jgi:hypothetical protein
VPTSALEAHLGTRQVSRVIYGAIVGLALVLVYELSQSAPGKVIATLFGTGVAVALAEVYSEVIGTETRTRRRITREQLRELLVDAAAVLFGVVAPCVFFVLAAVGLVATDTAFTLAKWTGLGLIGFYGWWAARLAGAGRAEAFVHAISIVSVGAVLIGLKALVH